ncbi:hypothetical protein RFI_31682 [Reticulomyxa filosa]|uniref:Uncharacterized protein n=1 Tax=Reticulomyxa filosa TaxID=46433 RepID=X6LUU7_RETFI|nr:hypothetical protein RFI_31682 [Reticulomyxa filosa]|eukprot:ETO05713.1 hypothetical protein RFI_31682 [Reticulomyxa filosa]
MLFINKSNFIAEIFSEWIFFVAKNSNPKNFKKNSISIHLYIRINQNQRNFEEKKMSKNEEGKSQEGAKTNLKLVLQQQSCLDKNWILQLNQHEDIHDFICLICNEILKKEEMQMVEQQKNFEEKKMHQ